MKPTQYTCLAMVSSSCLISPTRTDQVARVPSAIGHQSRERKRPSGEKAAEHQAEEMGEMRQSGVVAEDQEVELEEGELDDEWQERSGGGKWASESRRDEDWVGREPRSSWSRHTPRPSVPRGRGMRMAKSGAGLEDISKDGRAEAGPSSYPTGGMDSFHSAGRE